MLALHAPTEIIPLRCRREEGDVACALAVATDFAGLSKNTDGVFHPAEKSVFQAMFYEKRRKEYLLGRAAAKTAVGNLLGETDGSRIEIRSGVFRQPLVRHDSREIPEISLSHREEAAVAVASAAGHPLGIDFERVEPHRSEVIGEALSSTERDWAEYGHRDRDLIYAQIWTLKEALSKILRTGLTVFFPLFEVDRPLFYRGGLAQCVFKNFHQFRGHSWIAGPYVVSLVAPRKTIVRMDEDRLYSALSDTGEKNFSPE